MAPPPTYAPVPPVVAGSNVGGVAFGGSAGEVGAAVDNSFGAPVSADTTEFSTSLGGGKFGNGSQSFDYKWMTTRCYANGLCLIFGGSKSDPATHKFVGWRVTSAGGVSMANGVQVGSPQTDFAKLPLTLGPCPNRATAKVGDGTRLSLVSGSTNFYETDPGTPAAPAPDPSTVTVDEMHAGKVPQAITPSC